MSEERIREYHFEQVPCSNKECDYMAGIEIKAVSEEQKPEAYRVNVIILCPKCGFLTHHEMRRSTKEFKFT